MSDSILTWSVPNFITVTLMVALGAAIYIFATKAARPKG